MQNEKQNENEKMLLMLQQQLLLRKEGILKRITKRQEEIKVLEDKLSLLVDDYKKTKLFENSKKKALRGEIKKMEIEIEALLSDNKRDTNELKKLNAL